MMPAPKGNRFWEARSSHGREKTFSSPEFLLESCIEYFEWNYNNPLEKAIVYQGQVNESQVETIMRAMTMEGLCDFLEIGYSTWRRYGTDEKYKDYWDVIEIVEQKIRRQKFEGAAAGLLNANIIARDLGLKDGIEADHRSSDGSMTPKVIERVVVDPKSE